MTALPWIRDLLAGAGPWLAYEALSQTGRVSLGAGAAIMALVLVRLPRIREFKTLDGAILLFFVTMAISPEAANTDGPNLLLPLLLAGTALGSVLVGKPCTLQYARPMVGPEWWDNRHFIRVNQVLTLVWGGCFLAAAGLAQLSAGSDFPPWAARVLDVILFGAALWFTRTYPLWYRLHRYLPRVRAGLEPYLRAPRSF
jgi:hypothetical protein